MIRISSLCFSDGEKTIFDHFTLELPDTGVVALMGDSGRGKTTLLRLLAGLETPESGMITGIEGKKTAFLFQEDRLLPARSALKNVSLVSNEKTARQWLSALEIPDVNALPGALSGGMCRRVALARALAFGGDLLLLDEPFTGLDKALTARVIERIRDAVPLIIMSTHSEEDAALMGAEVIRI